MRSKYRNIKTEIGGHVFASQREARRYTDLKLLELTGKIERLELQPRFDIVVNGTKICRYIADFAYWKRGAGQQTVEDVKGFLTPVYRLKKKLVYACHGVIVEEV